MDEIDILKINDDDECSNYLKRQIGKEPQILDIGWVTLCLLNDKKHQRTKKTDLL